MGKIVKKRQKKLGLCDFLPIGGPALLYKEEEAKRVAETLNAQDDDWTYAANPVNPTRGLWEVRYTTPDGETDRISF